MRHLSLAFLILGGLAPLGTASQEAAPAPVVAKMEWEPGVPGASRPRQITLDVDLPAGLDIPAAVKDARHASILFAADLQMQVVVDVSSGRERIWLDHDFDGSVDDDPDPEFTKSGTQYTRTATLLVPFEGETQPVPVEALFRMMPSGATPTLYVSTRIHRVGEVVLGDRMRRIALNDEGNRLRFDEGGSVVLLLDVDGDGQLAAAHGTHEHLHLGQDFRLGDQGWSFRVADASGSRVEFVRLAEAPPESPREWNGPAPPPSPYRFAPPPETVEELEQRLEDEHDKTWQERNTTLRLLGWTGADEAFELLAEVAREDKDERVRAAAVRAMGNAAFLEAHAEEVLELAQGDEPLLAAAAIDSLYKMGFPELEATLLPLLESDEEEVIAAAAMHLGYLGSEAGLAAIRELVAEHPDDRVRYQAYQGLRRSATGPPSEVALLCARDRYAFLRAMALQDLAELRHPERREVALESVQDATTQIALFQPVTDILIEAGDEEAVEALFKLGAAGNADQQRKLADRLATLRSEHAIEAMLDNLRERQVERRLLSARVLADVVDVEVAEALAKQLRREKDLEVSLEIVEALGSQQGEEAVDALLRIAKKKGPLRGPGVRSLARMRSTDPKVQRFLVGLMDGRSWQDKIFAIDAAAASGELDLGREILPNLDDKQWEVRLATVQALRTLRSRDWVRPLIQQLGKEERARVRYEIADTLFELTGVSIHTNYPAWEKWWSEQGDSFQMPAMVPTRTNSGQGQTVSGFYGLPVDSRRLTFVIDQSGSMSARDTSARAETMSAVRTRLQQAVVETLNAIAGLDDDAWVNVILFESRVHPWRETVEPLSKSNRKDLQEHLRRQNPMGGTNLYDGLELALLDSDVDTIILLSDGMPGAGKYTGTQDILRAVERINQTRRITIHCVSLGRDSALLEQLAKAHGGRYVRR